MVDATKNKETKDDVEWQPFTTFVVEYQWLPAGGGQQFSIVRYRTCTHILESGENSEWEGIEGKPVMEWMLANVVAQAQGQLSSAGQLTGDEEPESQVLFELAEITVRDSDGHVASCSKGGNFSGFISHDSELELEAVIKTGKSPTGEKICYFQTDFFAISLADGSRRSLGSAIPEVDPSEDERLVVTLKDIHLETGVYAIRAVTLLNDHQPALDYLEGALLIVT